MRRTAISLVLILAFAGTAVADRVQETFDRTVDLRAGSPVSIDNVNGRIVVTTWDQPRVRIHAVKKAENGEALEKLRIDIRGGNGLEIETVMPKRNDAGFLDMLFGNDGNTSVDYDVTIPRNSNLKVDNTNGSITVSEVSGRIDLETTNGRIEALRCSGAIDASTTNGAIRAELLSVSSGKEMEFETTNGSISISVPSTYAATIDADTTNGSIRSDIPVTTRSFSRRELRGTINGGGPQLSLHTTNGSIEIRSAGAVAASK